MSLTPVANPYPEILGLSGSGLNNGSVYIGVAGQDPQATPQAVYWDAAGTIPAAQPLAVQGGYLVRLGTPASAYTATSYSMRVLDRLGVQVFYAPVVNAGSSFGSLFANPYDFGAAGNGVANDTVAFSAAAATGLPIMVPPGVYLIDPGAIELATPGQQIFGLNSDLCILKIRAALGGVNFIHLGAAQTEVRSLTLDGGGFIQPSPGGGAMVGFSSPDVIVEGNTFQNCDRLAVVGGVGGDRAQITDNTFLMKQIVGVRVASFTPGTGGPVSQTGLAATVIGGTIIEQAVYKYDTNGSGAVSKVYAILDGQYNPAGAVPAITFPAVPGSAAVTALCGGLVFAVLATGGVGSDWEVSDNYMLNAGICGDFSKAKIMRNRIRYWLYGGGITINAAPNVGGNLIADNYLYGGGFNTTTNAWQGPDTNNTVPQGIEDWGAADIVSRNRCEQTASCGIISISREGEVIDNYCISNGGYWAGLGNFTAGAGIVLLYSDATYNAGNATVHGNKCYDTAGVAGVQGYGIIASASITGISVEGNDCEGNRTGPYNLNAAALRSWRGRRLIGSKTFDPPSIAAGDHTETTLTVSGIDVAARWMLSATFVGLTIQPIYLTPYASGSNTVTVSFKNPSAGAADLASSLLIVSAEEMPA